MKKNLAAQIGLWSSVFLAVLGVAYLVPLIFYFATVGFVLPPSPSLQLIAGIVTFLTASTLLVLFTAIHHVHDDNKILGSLAISFIILFAATVSINRFVQLTVIQQSAPGASSQDLLRFMPYGSGSIMFALEMLGWGFFSSLAALCVAPLFSTSRLGLSIRWLFIAYAVFSSMAAIGYATETAITAGAFVAWGPILLALSICLAVYFRKMEQLPTPLP